MSHVMFVTVEKMSCLTGVDVDKGPDWWWTVGGFGHLGGCAGHRLLQPLQPGGAENAKSSPAPAQVRKEANTAPP